jgi:predicted RNA binding protein YcfA (HicA-like mRNA interferase family)
MPDLPAVSGKDAVKAFKKLGLVEVRHNGSHVHLRREAVDDLITIPVHGNKDLKKPLLKAEIKKAGFTYRGIYQRALTANYIIQRQP